MSNEPTDEQDLFFDETIAKLEEIAAVATLTVATLKAGDFDSATHLMSGHTGRFWETLANDVAELGKISDTLTNEATGEEV